jgi:DNA polymerase-1
LGAFPPYYTGPDLLFGAYYASAEIGCHLELCWPVPERVLDLFTEFRNHTNGLQTISGAGLLGALAHFGLNSIGAVEKNEMRDLVLRGGPWTDTERTAILDYCESDVASLARLLPAMLPHIDLPRALLRGRYMVAAAKMERNGVPIDTETLALLRRHWTDTVAKVLSEGYGADLTDNDLEKIGNDAFLIAYALAHGERTVVTKETSRPKAQKGNRKVPDVCDRFKVKWIRDF